MTLTLPFGAGVLAAFNFVFFELVVFPVLMYATSTLASFFIVKQTTKGNCVLVRTISYPLWNEGLFRHQLSHAVLFVIRIICVVIPVYLETRFISHIDKVPVSRLVPNAYVCSPMYEDIPRPDQPLFDLDVVKLPLEVFSRCAVVDEEGWLHAKVARVTPVYEQQEIHCITGSEQELYRVLDRFPPFVAPHVEDRGQYIDKTPAYQRNISLRILVDERPFHELKNFSRLQEGDVDRMYLQVKSVEVLNTKDMECFFWRSPVPEDSTMVLRVKTNSFICQNVTGQVVDFYYTSTRHAKNEIQATMLTQDRSVALKQFTVSTTFKFIGSLEFKDRILINAGHLIRKRVSPPPVNADNFEILLRNVLYTRANNVTVHIPGDEETHSVELDNVVLLVGALEIILVLLLGLAIAVVSRYKWKNMCRANNIEGLSCLWWRNRARENGWINEQTYIKLYLRKQVYDEEERYVYNPLPEPDET